MLWSDSPPLLSKVFPNPLCTSVHPPKFVSPLLFSCSVESSCCAMCCSCTHGYGAIQRSVVDLLGATPLTLTVLLPAAIHCP